VSVCNKANFQYIVVNLYTAVSGRVSNVVTNLYVVSLRNCSGVLISTFRDGLQRNWFSVVDLPSLSLPVLFIFRCVKNRHKERRFVAHTIVLVTVVCLLPVEQLLRFRRPSPQSLSVISRHWMSPTFLYVFSWSRRTNIKSVLTGDAVFPRRC
jgi:hypothetical protein